MLVEHDNQRENPRPQGTASPRSFLRPKQSISVRFGKAIRDPVNSFFAKQSLIGDSPIIDADQLPGLHSIRPQWQIMRKEALALLQRRSNIPPLGEVSPDHRRIARDENWKSLFLSGYGYQSEHNRALCPAISKAIDQIPGLVTAFLSIMEPGTHVPSHRGLTKAWLNCHLPLVLPDDSGRCEIEIAGSTYRWREGEYLVFDETYRHEVWNLSSQPRLILFMQLRRPMRWPGKALSNVIYHMIRRSSFVQDVRRKLHA